MRAGRLNESVSRGAGGAGRIRKRRASESGWENAHRRVDPDAHPLPIVKFSARTKRAALHDLSRRQLEEKNLIVPVVDPIDNFTQALRIPDRDYVFRPDHYLALPLEPVDGLKFAQFAFGVQPGTLGGEEVRLPKEGCNPVVLRLQVDVSRSPHLDDFPVHHDGEGICEA